MATKKVPAKKPPARKRATKSADKVDEQLGRYRSMRDFHVTEEPSGGHSKKASPKVGPTQWPFVIQKHAASHLHYDFRLGWNGVLKSWAVAKGPSYNTKDRRLAVQVEDHPMEYGGFEGIIPKGQYGGGTVMVWDQGTWEPQPGQDVDEGLRNGSLKFVLNGKKMHGKWTLVRMHDRPGTKPGSKPSWLLIKEHDDYERGPDDPAITDEAPDSAVTGRTLEQIAAQEDHVWNSKDTAGKDQAWFRKSAPTEPGAPGPDSGTRVSSGPKLSALPRESQPDFLAPQLALEASEPPATEDWLHELKLDGYRIQARKSGQSVKLLTRKGLDWTHRMKPVAAALQSLPAKHATLDGEVCVVRPDGTTSFADLQAWFQNSDPATLTYFAFDLLHLDGHNTRGLPLLERKALLADLIAPIASDSLQFSDHTVGDGPKLFHSACEHHAEGIISKRADSPYTGKRSSTWLKSKCLHEQEFVIAGYTDSSEGAGRIGSLLLGVYDDAGKLIYTGRTGTGFTQALKRSMHKTLHALETSEMPFARTPADARRDVHWVEPRLVAQVRFATWTADNLVRQAAFLGLREDKSADEVQRESVAPKPKSANRKSRQAVDESPAAPAIRLTHPDKILDPETKLTKRQLADYYTAVAEHMFPHVAGRPLSLVRCPEGAGKPCFYQKHVNHMLPAGIGTVMVRDKKSSEPEPYITLSTAEALAGLAQIGVLEVHPWGSRNDDLEHPDRLILDLDPDESLSWSVLTEAAAEVRERLKKLGLTSFLKTTGGKGLHVVAPIAPTLTFAQIKDAAHRIVLSMERDNPRLYLTKMTKAARAGKIYLDYLRNERGATAVAPFSPRARPGVSASVPLPWSALRMPKRPVFRVSEFVEWRSVLQPDPWKAMATTRQTLDLERLQ